MRKTYLRIDLNGFQENIRALEKHTNKRMMAIVKADAYGIGVEESVLAAREAGVSAFGVATLEEGMQLRRLDATAFIQLLGPVDDDDLALAKEYSLAVVTTNRDCFQAVNDLSGLSVSLKIDTGMHRIGLYPQEVPDMQAELLRKGAKIVGIFTHFAKSDTDLSFTAKQFELFAKVVKDTGLSFDYISCCNSDAALAFSEDLSGYIRCGIALWGYTARRSFLKETCGLYTHVTNVRKARFGEGISYGGKYISDGEGYILTVPIGYADGIRRSYTGHTVFVEDEEAPIVGTICMDQLMIRTQKEYPVGTRVEFFGTNISLYEYADRNQTIPYEILCNISHRVKRVYQKNGVISEDIPRYANSLK